MESNSSSQPPGVRPHAPGSERKVWETLLADREVIDRLRITPDELQALRRMSFLGAVTCKEDFLFVLRQMRDACDSEPGAAIEPPPLAAVRPSPKPKTARMLNAAERKAASAPPAPGRDVDHGSLAEITRRRRPEQLGVFVLMLILISLSVWVLFNAILSWRHGFDSKIGVASHREARGVTRTMESAWAGTTEVRVS